MLINHQRGARHVQTNISFVGEYLQSHCENGDGKEFAPNPSESKIWFPISPTPKYHVHIFPEGPLFWKPSKRHGWLWCSSLHRRTWDPSEPRIGRICHAMPRCPKIEQHIGGLMVVQWWFHGIILGYGKSKYWDTLDRPSDGWLWLSMKPMVAWGSCSLRNHHIWAARKIRSSKIPEFPSGPGCRIYGSHYFTDWLGPGIIPE